MTLRECLETLHQQLLQSYSHVNADQILDDGHGGKSITTITIKDSEWYRPATHADVAEIQHRVGELATALIAKE
jgi:hypothetical protein